MTLTVKTNKTNGLFEGIVECYNDNILLWRKTSDLHITEFDAINDALKIKENYLIKLVLTKC